MSDALVSLDGLAAGAPVLNKAAGASVTLHDATPGPAPASLTWEVYTAPSSLLTEPVPVAPTLATTTFATDADVTGESYLVKLTRIEADTSVRVGWGVVGVPDEDGHVLPPAQAKDDFYGVVGSVVAGKKYGWSGSASAGTDFMLNNFLRFTKARANSAYGGSVRYVKAASTGNVNLAATVTSLDTITINNEDRVLIWQQSVNTENGLYRKDTGTGLLVRTSDANTTALLQPGMIVYVEQGDVNGTVAFKLAATGAITIGASSIVFRSLMDQSGGTLKIGHNAETISLGLGPATLGVQATGTLSIMRPADAVAAINMVPDFGGTGALIVFDSSVTVVGFFIADYVTTGSNNGADVHIQAQTGQDTTTGNPNNNGGNLFLLSGQAGQGGDTPGAQGYILLGHENNPAQSGFLRTPPWDRWDGILLARRHSSFLADTRIIWSNSGPDDIDIGDTNTDDVWIHQDAGKSFTLDRGGTNIIEFTPTYCAIATDSVRLQDSSLAETLRLTLAATGATSMTIASTVTSFRLLHTQRAGTGVNAGSTITFTAQQGQNVSGGTNNDGGSIRLEAGAPGTGGGAGSFGSVFIAAAGLGDLLEIYPFGGTRTILESSLSSMQILVGTASFFVSDTGFVQFSPATSGAGANTVYFGNGATITCLVPQTGAVAMTIAAVNTSFTLSWVDNTTNSATGGVTTLQGQNCTGTTSVGGVVNITGGTGTSDDGDINVTTGAGITINGEGSVVLKVDTTTWVSLTSGGGMQIGSAGTSIDMFSDAFTWSATATPSLIQNDKTTNSGTGATFTIQAQNETGTTSNGGVMDIRSGTGTSANGAIQIRSGATKRFEGNATGVGFNAATPIARPDYTITNPTTLRTIDVSAATLSDVRQFLGTMAQDFIDYGLFQ